MNLRGYSTISHYLHLLSPESVLLPFRLCLPFWYLLLIGLVLSCCSPPLYPDWNSFTRQSFPLTESPPAPIDAGSLFHRLCRHRYYGFFRLLTTHWFAFPVQVIAHLPVSLRLIPVTQKRVGFWINVREDVMRPPSVTQESIHNHLDCDHPSNHYLLKLPFVHGMSHHTKATYSSLLVSSCGYRY
jgi:hypothetical protein